MVTLEMSIMPLPFRPEFLSCRNRREQTFERRQPVSHLAKERDGIGQVLNYFAQQSAPGSGP
jgi:hypothetical protein